MSKKRPAFQFYPADWRKDTPLQSCSIGARGLWVELCCVMHECTPYGHLAVNGRPMDYRQAARLCGVGEKEFRKLLGELETAKVPSRTPDDVLYSRRMVRDEAIRNSRAEGGPKSLDNPNVPRPKDTAKDGAKGYPSGHPSIPSFGGSPSSSSSSSTSEIEQEPRTAAPAAPRFPQGVEKSAEIRAPGRRHRNGKVPNGDNYRPILKLAHELLANGGITDEADLRGAVKAECHRLGIRMDIREGDDATALVRACVSAWTSHRLKAGGAA